MLFLQFLILVTVIIVLNGCSFGHKNFDQTNGPFKEPHDFVIQIDDFGEFWDPTVAARALDKITEISSTKNTIVILYVHGWHHNAAVNNKNALEFAETMKQVRLKVDDNVNGKPGIYRKSRELLTGQSDAEIIGLYIGWRGKSFPMPFNYLTFWSRKAAAQRVGQGDLNELLHRLNQIYSVRNNNESDGSKKPFMGLVTLGHSFGAQVLFSAVNNTLEDELIKVAPNTSSKTQQVLSDNLKGFGDLVVLINPALEAFQYERLHQLNQRMSYSREQTPLLLVLSSAADLPRKILFPIGRWVDTVIRPTFRPGQRARWTQALGEFLPQRTHTVELLTDPTHLSKHFDSSIYVNDPCYVVNYDLTNVPLISGMRLKPTSNHHKYNPYLIAYADAKVIWNHGKIFEKELRDFLNDYIAINQAKRILLRDPKSRGCEP